MADAPQSGDEVRLVVEGLQRLDHRLNVRWEPRAVMVRRGRYTVDGKVIDPVYRGLWEIILDDKSVGTANWRSWTRICFVTKPTMVMGVLAMAENGEYAPLGQWVVEFMQAADKHNQEQARRLRAKLDAMNDADDERAIRAGDDATAEAAARQYFEGTKAGSGVSEFHPVGIDLKA